MMLFCGFNEYSFGYSDLMNVKQLYGDKTDSLVHVGLAWSLL